MQYKGNLVHYFESLIQGMQGNEIEFSNIIVDMQDGLSIDETNHMIRCFNQAVSNLRG